MVSGRLDSNPRASAADKFLSARLLIPTEPAGISLRGTPRRGVANFFRQTCQEWKSGNESDAAHSVFSRTMKIDNLLCRDLRMSRDVIEVGSKLRIVAHWNFNSSRRRSPGPAGLGNTGYSRANSRREPLEFVFRCNARFCDGDRIKENCDAGISRASR